MVSVLGEYNYTFPKPIPLKLKLKDMLEDNVAEKYFLSNKMIDYCLSTSSGGFDRSVNFLNNLSNPDIAMTITTKAGNRATDNFIKVKNATKKGYLEAKEGESNNNTQWYQQDRIYDDNVSISITTECNPYYATKDVVKLGNYSPSNHNASRIVDKEYSAPTVMENHGTITATQTNDLRIRKLTPRECFRLMGVKDEDFDKVAKNQSDSSLYHLAGDSIVVDVFKALIKEMI